MTEEAISTDHVRHAQEVEPSAKTDWMRATAEACVLLTKSSEA